MHRSVFRLLPGIFGLVPLPFGAVSFSVRNNRRRQRACLQWVVWLLRSPHKRLPAGRGLICADNGDLWGEDGFLEHGITHSVTFKVAIYSWYVACPPPSSCPPGTDHV